MQICPWSKSSFSLISECRCGKTDRCLLRNAARSMTFTCSNLLQISTNNYFALNDDEWAQVYKPLPRATSCLLKLRPMWAVPKLFLVPIARDCQEFWKLWNHMPQPSELFEQAAADAMGCGFEELWEPLGMRGN